ncbi:MAG: long-chain fatty acid--CoA ligase [Chloroflexota bacterium]|nr:long-chain fatty acid--CoA ligase [Chloroflexota bacterium]
MRTESPLSAGGVTPYDQRPWLRHYPVDVPAHLEYSSQTMSELLDETVQGYGHRPAFVFQNHAMTFQELQLYAGRVASGLQRAEVRKGDVVLVLLPNVPHFPVAYHGILQIGAILAAASPLSVERELENLITDSGARIIITIDLLFDKVMKIYDRCGVELVVVGSVVDFMPPWVRLAGRLSGKTPKPKQPVRYGGKVQSMRAFMRSGRVAAVPVEVVPGDVALLQYTGGTTGTPKGATLTHANLLANGRQMLAWFPTLKKGDETILAVLPFFHVYGVTLAMNGGLLLAANTVLIARLVISDILDAVRRHRPSIFPGVPTLYAAIVNDERAKHYDLSSIDVCACGGAPLPAELKRDFENLTGGHLYEGYGLSEASPLTHAVPHDGRDKPGSMGFPVVDTDARIVNERGEAVPIDEAGELEVRGPQIMQGYWRRPEETAEVFHDGWLRTGDVARMDEEGWFYLVDRKKDLIITGGENIYPREIEEVLFEHPQINEVAVVGVPHPYGGEIAKAFVVLAPGETATKKDIIQFAAARLAKHKVPRAVEFRAELPKSAAQKVLRRVLADEERARQAEKRRK